jgi:Flp pilus assembly protein TadG
MSARRHESGQAMAEFALTALVFFTLVFFILDGGRILWHYVSVSQAARIGARYAITHGDRSKSPIGPGAYQVNCGAAPDDALCTEIRSRVGGFDQDELSVAARWDAANSTGNRVSVTVNYRMEPLTNLFWSNLVLNLHSTSVMVIQN